MDGSGNAVVGAALAGRAPTRAEILSHGAGYPQSADENALLEKWTPFGIAMDKDRMTYLGQMVRPFVDGAVDTHALHPVSPNPDGSYTPWGIWSAWQQGGTRL